MDPKQITFLNDNRFLKAKGAKLEKTTLTLDDGTVMTPLIKAGKIVGFTAVGRDGKKQQVVHMHLKATKTPKRVYKKATKPPVKKPKVTCYYCRCTEISCVCVPTPCQG